MKLALESFEKLIKSLPEPILLITGEGEILAANSPFLRIFKPDRPDLQSKTLFDLALTERATLLTYLNSCSRSRQILFGAIELNHRGTGPRAFRCEGAALEPASETSPALIFLRLIPKDSAGSRFQTLTRKIEELNKEIAERLRAEQEKERLFRAAEEANRLKDEFLATVSHELRTPLNAILGWAQMLRSGNLDEATFNNALEVIERNARSQKQLTEDLLDVSRIISGKVRLDIHPTDLAHEVSTAVEALRPTAKNKSIRLEAVIDPQAGMISADPERIQQVMWNLISNAIKFTPKKGRVQVRLERVNSHLEIIVSDTGEGIPPDFLPHVFDRFRQSDSSSSRQHGGLGLGLAIVRHLVELHGGSVQAHSEGIGKGSIFVIMLPILIMREKAGPPDQVFPRRHPTADRDISSFDFSPKLTNLHLLVVDDEPDARELLKTILEKCEAKVTVAANAVEGLELIGKSNFDLFISDIEMPHENGYSLIKKVRSFAGQKKSIPAIALTAHARTQDRLQALSAGFDTHIAKPFEAAELVVVIERLIRRSR